MNDLSRDQLGALIRRQAKNLVLGTALLFLAAGSLWSHFALGALSLTPSIVILWLVFHSSGIIVLKWPRLERAFFLLNLIGLQIYFHTVLYRFQLPYLPTAPVFFVVGALSLAAYVHGKLGQLGLQWIAAWSSAVLWLRSTYQENENFKFDQAMIIAVSLSALFMLCFVVLSRFSAYRLEKQVALLGPRASYDDQRMQAAKLQSLGELLASVAHEINNPLLSISGYSHQIKCELAAKGRLDRALLKTANERIKFNVDRIVALSRSLRDFSRDTSHDPFEPVSLNDVVNDAVLLMEHNFKSQKVDLLREAPSDDAYVWGSRVQLSQIVVNLLANARDACLDLDRKRVKVGYRSEGERLLLWVEDSGPGIDSAVAQKLFTPFFTTKVAGKGTGLGLSIAQSIAVKHKGSVDFQVRKDKQGRPLGTVFVLDLPRHNSAKAQSAA